MLYDFETVRSVKNLADVTRATVRSNQIETYLDSLLDPSTAISTSSELFRVGDCRFTPRALVVSAEECCGGDVARSARGLSLDRKFIESLLRSLVVTECPQGLADLSCRTEGVALPQRSRGIVWVS